MGNEVDLRKQRKVEAAVTVTGVATEVTQLENKGLLTDIKGFFTNTYNQLTNWLAVKVINTVTVSGTVSVNPSTESKLLQVDSVGSTTYLGYAEAGTLTSSATWAIKRITETGSDVSITWADGNNSFDNIWNNRLALTYA